MEENITDNLKFYQSYQTGDVYLTSSNVIDYYHNTWFNASKITFVEWFTHLKSMFDNIPLTFEQQLSTGFKNDNIDFEQLHQVLKGITQFLQQDKNNLIKPKSEEELQFHEWYHQITQTITFQSTWKDMNTAINDFDRSTLKKTVTINNTVTNPREHSKYFYIPSFFVTFLNWIKKPVTDFSSKYLIIPLASFLVWWKR